MPRKTGSRPINGLTPKRFRGGPCHIPAHVDRGGKSLRLISTGCCILCNRERLREVAKTEKGRAVSKDYITRRAALVRDLNQIAPSLEAHHQDCRKVGCLACKVLNIWDKFRTPIRPAPRVSTDG
jgi:hypothetical protein